MDKPGIKGKPFYVQFDDTFNNRDKILTPPEIVEIEVTKVYSYPWWKQILVRMGFKLKMFDCEILDKKDNEHT